ncbi:MAG TPA: hypothetical protein VI457_00435 [Methylococcaceae bacterium]|nr:hypothetical protein [Methylococcaceae bacterium]
MKSAIVLGMLLAGAAEAGDVELQAEAIRRSNTQPCYGIQNPDRRAACFAEVRNSAYLCSEIKDRTERELCIARTWREQR